jgi:acyl-CoA synthetase (AMP-forming)/AMP-acid ligase II
VAGKFVAEADLIKRGQQETALVYMPSNSAAFWTTRDLLATGFRYQKLLIVCFLGVVLLAVLATALKPREFESEAKVLVKHERADPLVTAGAEQVEAPDRNVSAEELNSEVCQTIHISGSVALRSPSSAFAPD